MNNNSPHAAALPDPVTRTAAYGHLAEPDTPHTHPAAGGEPTWSCARPGCDDWVMLRDDQLYGTATQGECRGHRRPIDNTEHRAWHPWPESVTFQGGYGWANSQGFYEEWFFEAFPPGPPASFLRTTGPSMREAEAAAWRAWQTQLACPAAPGHGPFDPRGYTNGSAWCTSCGYWFNRVLLPTPPPPGSGSDHMSRLHQAVEHLTRAPLRAAPADEPPPDHATA